MKTKSLVFDVTVNAPVAKVWQAITDKDEMKQWYFDLADFQLEPGFQFSFIGGNEDRVYVHLCRVLEVEPLKKLSHSWMYEGYEGYSVVTWYLVPDGENTRVQLTHAGLDSFPATNPDFAANNFDQGWTYILNTSLKNYLQTPATV